MTQALLNPEDRAPKKPQPRSAIGRLFTVIGIILLACITLVVGGYVIVFRGLVGEPANLNTSERVTTEFVVNLAEGRPQAAYDMLAAPAKVQTQLEDVSALADQVGRSGYSALRMCEFQLIFGQYGKQLVGLGLMRHNQGLTVVQSTLVQEGGGDWRVLSFQLQPDVDPKPWGRCQYDPP